MSNPNKFPNFSDSRIEGNFRIPLSDEERKRLDELDRMATDRALGTTGIYAANSTELQLTSDGITDF